MIGRRFVILACVAVPILSLAGCTLLFPQWTYRYRITVEVEQDGRLHTGSSVIEVMRDKGLTGIGGKARGEAVAVDIGKQGTLFALMTGKRGGADWAFTMPHFAYRTQLGTTDMVSAPVLNRLSEMQGVQVTLDTTDYPTLVRFRDIRDPKSVELVDPANLTASFGPGVKLRRITVEITDDPVTTGIKQKLPSFGPETGFDAWYRHLPFGDPRQISVNDFRTGSSK